MGGRVITAVGTSHWEPVLRTALSLGVRAGGIYLTISCWPAVDATVLVEVVPTLSSGLLCVWHPDLMLRPERQQYPDDGLWPVS